MTPWGGRRAVLSVHIPGRAPYAVIEPRYKRPRGKADHVGAGLPALVSTTDPNDVEILWDEVPSLESQVEQRISDAFKGQEGQMEQAREMQARMMEAVQGPGSADPTATGVPQPSAAMDAMTENAKQALAYVQDPAMRKMLIKQYRAAGIPVEEGDEAP